MRVLDQLCVAGLVERRDDPRDGRAKTLHLTPEGDKLAAVIEDAVREVRAQLLSGISDADLTAALRAFSALETALAAAAKPEG